MNVRLPVWILLFCSCSLVAPALAPEERAAPADASAAAEPASLPSAEAARAAFERLKGLEGRWLGRSTMGWKDEVRFDVIARGSVVMETSRFEAHPGETMVTMFHMDGERLLLTHYCVAKNQPRLVATAIEDGGGHLSFTFADATGIASRDQGHMDSAELFFEAGTLRSVWSWYQDGASRPMEEIRLERAD
jgi:hypothetical protein